MEKPPVILPKEISFQWSRDFMKLRARCFMSRSSYRLPFGICLGVAALGVGGLVFDSRPESHIVCWQLLLFQLYPALVYGWRYLATSRIRHTDLNRRITARIEQESFSIDNGEIVTTLRWKAVKRLWKFPDLFLLFTDIYRPTFVTLPVNELAEETKTFIETKVRENGGKIS